MKISLSKISREGLEVSEELAAKELELNTEEIQFVSSIKATAQVTRQQNLVNVSVELRSRTRKTCSRCLQEFIDDFNQSCKITTEVGPNQEFLDVTDNIREDILLNYPLKILCKQDCRGLCPICGKNLNDGDCGCASGL
jgi:uncharacterized protein